MPNIPKYNFSKGDFRGSKIYIESLIDGVVREGGIGYLISELSEWKFIHNESQRILNSMNMPHNYITRYRFTHDYIWLEEAGIEWQNSCYRKIKGIPGKWKLIIANSLLFNDLKEITSGYMLGKITKQFMQPDIGPVEFGTLVVNFTNLYNMVWDLLTIADKRILILIELLKKKGDQEW